MGLTAVTKLHFYLAPMNYPLKADISRPLTAHITGMCGRDTYKPAWEEIVALCRLTLGLPAVNTRVRYNVRPTTTIDTIVVPDDNRRLERMRWPYPVVVVQAAQGNVKLATFNPFG